MLEYIAIQEAQAMLPSLMQRVAQGDEFALTHQGMVMGRIVPSMPSSQNVDRFLALTKQAKFSASAEEVMAWRDEGRKG